MGGGTKWYEWINPAVGASHLAASKATDAVLPATPAPPSIPGLPPPPPDESAMALRNAKLMERRRQLGLQGRMTTFLTGSQGDTAPAQTATATLLGQ